MPSPYKLCFLGYRQLTDIAQQVVPELPFNDCEIQIIDCLPDTLPEIVSNMTVKGFEVFIAGGANAATFSRHSQAHMQEIVVRDIDYLTALKKARKLGSRIAIAWHRLSRELNIELFAELAGFPVEMISYEDSEELYDLIRDSVCEVIVGASQACSYAAEHNKKSVLVYAGKDTVRRSFVRARHLAMELRKEQRYRAISQSLIQDLPLGILITNEEGRITLINPLAREYLNVNVNFARGRLLADIAPNLSPDNFLEKGLQSAESYKILGGIRYRCRQRRLISKGEDIGAVTTLHVDNSRKAQKAAPGAPSGAARWKELTAESDSMKAAIALGRKYAASSLPLGLIGDVSSHRQMFAECIHTGGPRAQGPLIMVNLPQISANDAGRHLLGSIDEYAPHTGLTELANNGTLVLKNVQDACPAVQDILLDVLSHNRIIPTGGYHPIEINVRFISVFDKPLAEEKIRSDLLCRLCTLRIDLPLLSERQEDLPALFSSLLAVLYGRDFPIANYKKAADVLKLYSWPGNTSELEAAAGRFATELNSGAKITAHTVHSMMIRAIGEDRLYQELVKRHSCLTEKKPDPEALRKAIDDLKYYLGYNNSNIAERLGISRASLWRALKENDGGQDG